LLRSSANLLAWSKGRPPRGDHHCIVPQGKALAVLLSTTGLIAGSYGRSRKTFLLDRALLAAGIAVALLLAAWRLARRTLAP
jgi:hypothetical protein